MERLAFDLLFQKPPFNYAVEGILRRRVCGKVTQYVPSDLTLVSCTHMHQSRWPTAWDPMQLCGPPQINDFTGALRPGMTFLSWSMIKVQGWSAYVLSN